MLFNQPVQTLFVDTRTPAIETEMMCDVILSPAFYWVKRQSLPVRYLREVKKLLPSLFEDTLPEGNYSYSAYRDGEEYVLFAYNDRFILDELGKKGIKASQIRKVYFAQSEFGCLEAPQRIDDESLLVAQNGIIIKLPIQFVAEDADEMDLTGHKCVSHTVDLARYAHIADRGSVMRFGALMAVLIVLIATQWGIVAAKSGELESKRAELFTQYGLKSTMMQNEAILKRLEADYRRQSALRSAAAKLLSLKLQKDEYMSGLNVEGTVLQVSFVLAKPERSKVITSELKRKGATFKERLKGKELELEVTL